MECPRCKLHNPDSAERCDCGYHFKSGITREELDTSQGERFGCGLALVLYVIGSWTIGALLSAFLLLSGELDRGGVVFPDWVKLTAGAGGFVFAVFMVHIANRMTRVGQIRLKKVAAFFLTAIASLLLLLTSVGFAAEGDFLSAAIALGALAVVVVCVYFYLRRLRREQGPRSEE